MASFAGRRFEFVRLNFPLSGGEGLQCQGVQTGIEFLAEQTIYQPVASNPGQAVKVGADDADPEVTLGTGRHVVTAALVGNFQMLWLQGVQALAQGI